MAESEGDLARSLRRRRWSPPCRRRPIHSRVRVLASRGAADRVGSPDPRRRDHLDLARSFDQWFSDVPGLAGRRSGDRRSIAGRDGPRRSARPRGLHSGRRVGVESSARTHGARGHGTPGRRFPLSSIRERPGMGGRGGVGRLVGIAFHQRPTTGVRAPGSRSFDGCLPIDPRGGLHRRQRGDADRVRIHRGPRWTHHATESDRSALHDRRDRPRLASASTRHRIVGASTRADSSGHRRCLGGVVGRDRLIIRRKSSTTDLSSSASERSCGYELRRGSPTAEPSNGDRGR